MNLNAISVFSYLVLIVTLNWFTNLIVNYDVIFNMYKDRQNKQQHEIRSFDNEIRKKINYQIHGVILFILFEGIFISICSVGYLQNLDEKSHVLSLKTPYPCNYTFIESKFYNGGEFQVYVFELEYNSLKKEFVYKCGDSQECSFPKYNTVVDCYGPNKFQTFSYFKPDINYDNPKTLLVALLIHAILVAIVLLCGIALVIWITYYIIFIKHRGAPDNNPV